MKKKNFFYRMLKPHAFSVRGCICLLKDCQKGQPGFPKDTLYFRGRMPHSHGMTPYTGAWEDYRVLSQNTNAVIIRKGYAIRWKKKGKLPEKLPLHRFATKYKRQPLLGDPDEINAFLSNIELYIAQAIRESKKKKGIFFETDSGAKAEEVPAAPV